VGGGCLFGLDDGKVDARFVGVGFDGLQFEV